MRYAPGDEVRKLNGHQATATVVSGTVSMFMEEPTYYLKYEDQIDLVLVVESDITDAPRGSVQYREDYYNNHKSKEHWGDPEWNDDPSHPDGCFWCGKHTHPSDVCTERDDSYMDGA